MTPTPSVSIAIYLLLMLNLVRDDLILLNWLLTFDPEENANRAEKAKASGRQQQQQQKKSE